MSLIGKCQHIVMITMMNFVRESNIDRNLNPRISDYGSVDKVEMNKDIKAYLTRYLSE